MKKLRLGWGVLLLVPAFFGTGCSQSSPTSEPGSGAGGTGGAQAAGSGGATSGSGGLTSGGTAGSGGTTPTVSGGAPGTGGSGTGGVPAAGGSAGSAGSGGTAGSGGSGDEGIVVPVGATPDERHLLLRDEGNSVLHYVDLGVPSNTWHAPVPIGRDMQLVGDNRILIGTENGYEERSAVDGSVLFTQDQFAGTIAARRMRNGNTLLCGANWLGETGIVLIEIDAAGTETKRVVYPQYDYVRLVRPTPSGNYLVTSNITIFEGDSAGNIVWEVNVQDSTEAHAWKALRLTSGETVVATGYEASLQRFSASEQFLGRIKAPSQVTPNFFSDFQVLPSGNYLVANWQGHGTGLGSTGTQIIELSPAGTLVWSWQQDASFVSSLQGVILLDGLNLGKLHVEDTTGELVPVD